MTMFLIDESAVDTMQGGGGSDLFPRGSWDGALEETRVRTIYPGDPADFLLKVSKEVTADSVEVVSFRFGDFRPVLEGQPNVGQRKFFTDDLVLSYEVGGSEYHWLRPSDDDAPRLSYTRRHLTNLARAIGLVEREGNKIGPSEQFVGGISNEGEGINGSRAVLQVDHRSFKKRDGSKGEAHFVASYEASV